MIPSQSLPDVFVATNEICDEKDDEGTKDSSGNDEQGGKSHPIAPRTRRQKNVTAADDSRSSSRIAMKSKLLQPTRDDEEEQMSDPKPKRASKKGPIAQTTPARKPNKEVQQASQKVAKETSRAEKKSQRDQEAVIKREVEKAVKSTTAALTKAQDKCVKEAKEKSEQEIQRLGKIVTQQAEQLSNLQKL